MDLFGFVRLHLCVTQSGNDFVPEDITEEELVKYLIRRSRSAVFR